MSYGGDFVQSHHRTSYPRRILSGERSLPIFRFSSSRKVELVVNLKAAKLLGHPVLRSIIAGADEVIE